MGDPESGCLSIVSFLAMFVLCRGDDDQWFGDSSSVAFRQWEEVEELCLDRGVFAVDFVILLANSQNIFGESCFWITALTGTPSV